MKTFVVVLSCFAAVALANPTTSDIAVEFLANGRARCRMGCNAINPASCPPTNCPPADRNPSCGAPDCNNPGNRAVLHPTLNPNDFYQCVQDRDLNHVAKVRPCACGTFFQTSANRCVHPRDWTPDCPQQQAPILRECVEECFTCDDENGNPTDPTTSTPGETVGTPSQPYPTDPIETTTPDGNGCDCPCVPCIWWPCLPCLRDCLCNQQQRQPQLPQNPWQPPQDQWNRPQVPQEPQHPWQRPQQPEQDQWNRPEEPQRPWQRPQQPEQDQWNRPEEPQHPWQRPQQPEQDPWNRPPQRPWAPQEPWGESQW